MKTQDLNLVSSPAVARLEKLEISGFLTLAPVAVAQCNAIRRSSRNSAFCILNSSIEVAGLKTLEKPRTFTPSQSTIALATVDTPRRQVAMTPLPPTPRESTTQQIRTLVGTLASPARTSIRACPATAAVPLFPLRLAQIAPLMRNHHDSAASPLQNSALCTLHSAFNRCPSKKIFFINNEPTTLYTR
jgi:hypothetical protein